MVRVFLCSLILLTSTLATSRAHAANVALASAENNGTELDALFTNSEVKPKAMTSAWPEDVSENLNDSLTDDDEEPERDIASVTKWKKTQKTKANAKKKRPALHAKPKASPPATARVVGRRSHLPSTVKNGFEIRVKASGIVTTFWVSQRGLRQDLLYANSGGSRASISLSPENFRVLQEHALKIPVSNTSVKTCPTNNMQIHVVQNGVERTSTFCVNAKSDGAEKLRNLGNTLVVWVR